MLKRMLPALLAALLVALLYRVSPAAAGEAWSALTLRLDPGILAESGSGDTATVAASPDAPLPPDIASGSAIAGHDATRRPAARTAPAQPDHRRA